MTSLVFNSGEHLLLEMDRRLLTILAVCVSLQIRNMYAFSQNLPPVLANSNIKPAALSSRQNVSDQYMKENPVYNNSTKANSSEGLEIDERLLVRRKKYNRTREYHEYYLPNGTKVAENRTKTVIYETITDIQDDQFYIINSLIFNVAELYNDVSFEEKAGNVGRTAAKRYKVYELLQKTLKQKDLDDDLRNLIRINLEKVRATGQTNNKNITLASLLLRIISELESFVLIHTEKGFQHGKRLSVRSLNDTTRAFIKNIKLISSNASCELLLHDIIEKLLQKETNRKIHSLIDSKIKFVMQIKSPPNFHNIRTQDKVKSILDMVVHIVSQLGYRLYFKPASIFYKVNKKVLKGVNKIVNITLRGYVKKHDSNTQIKPNSTEPHIEFDKSKELKEAVVGMLKKNESNVNPNGIKFIQRIMKNNHFKDNEKELRIDIAEKYQIKEDKGKQNQIFGIKKMQGKSEKIIYKPNKKVEVIAVNFLEKNGDKISPENRKLLREVIECWNFTSINRALISNIIDSYEVAKIVKFAKGKQNQISTTDDKSQKIDCNMLKNRYNTNVSEHTDYADYITESTQKDIGKEKDTSNKFQDTLKQSTDEKSKYKKRNGANNKGKFHQPNVKDINVRSIKPIVNKHTRPSGTYLNREVLKTLQNILINVLEKDETEKLIRRVVAAEKSPEYKNNNPNTLKRILTKYNEYNENKIRYDEIHKIVNELRNINFAQIGNKISGYEESQAVHPREILIRALVNILDKAGSGVNISDDIKERIKNTINAYDLRNKNVSYRLVKILLKDLGYNILEDLKCVNSQNCMQRTENLRKELSQSDDLQNFINYLNGRLYEYQFASNIVHKKSNKKVDLYQTFEQEYERNDFNKHNLAQVLWDKIATLKKILAFMAVVNKNKKNKAPNQIRTIQVNNNPIDENTFIYRQNNHDAGYLITLDKPNKLVHASVDAFAELGNTNKYELQESDNGHPYIKVGQSPVKITKSYTLIQLEFFTNKSQNVKLLLKLDTAIIRNIVPIHLNVDGIEVNGSISLVGKTFGEAANIDKKLKILTVQIKRLDFNSVVGQDLEGCIFE